MVNDTLIAKLGSIERFLTSNWVAERTAEIAASGELNIDLSEDSLSARSDKSLSAIRLDPCAILALSNLLLSEFRSVPLSVRLPENRGILLQLTRGGLFFALANREKENTTLENRWAYRFEQVAEEWQRPYFYECLARSLASQSADVSTDQWMVSAAFQRYLISVVGVHHRPADVARHELDYLATRWLSSRVRGSERRDLASTLRRCSELFYESLVNISDHAGLSSAEAGSVSLGQVYATLGGGRDSFNRLNFAAFDTGVGIVQSVRTRKDVDLTGAEEIVEAAISGDLPSHGAGRGFGLSRIKGIVGTVDSEAGNPGGSLRILTSDGTGGCVLGSWSHGDGAVVTTRYSDCAVTGTLVVVSLNIRRAVLAESERQTLSPAEQLELTFGQPA